MHDTTGAAMDSPRRFKYSTPSPRASAPPLTYALPYKRLDPFAPASPSAAATAATTPTTRQEHQQQHQHATLESARSPRTKQSNDGGPKSLSEMNFDAPGMLSATVNSNSSSGGSSALYSMLSASAPTTASSLSTSSASPSTAKFPIKPQHPHPRTSVAATAEFLDTLRARSLLDYSFMREFSLARKKPVPERSLSKLSASSVYSMRMAQLSLEDQGRSFAGRQQWLLKPESLASAKSDGDVRAPANTNATGAGGGPATVPTSTHHSRSTRFKRSRMHKAIAAADPPDSDAAVACFPTLWGSSSSNVQDRHCVSNERSVPTSLLTAPRAAERPQRQELTPARAGTNHSTGAKTRSTAPTPQSSVLLWHDLSPFDLRKCHASAVVAQHHGFLAEQDIPALMAQTGYNRTELFALWARFKALCSISRAPHGIDRDTFHRGIPQLSVEDDFFIDRVFAILDADGSGILEWQEFLEALSSLEKGDVVTRVGFLFRVYDLNGDGTIHRAEAQQFFLASLLIAPTDDVVDVTRHFVDKIFAAVGCGADESMRIDHALAYMHAHPATDIYSLFGRTMVSRRHEPSVVAATATEVGNSFANASPVNLPVSAASSTAS